MSLDPRNASGLRERTSRAAIALKNLVRRVSLAATRGSTWQVQGYDGEPADDVELFPGIGIYARPRAGRGEAIVLKVAGTHPVIVATRDDSHHIELDADETAVFNSTGALVRITKEGDIVVRAKPGREVFVDDGSGAQALATKADIDALASWGKLHVHPDPSSGSTGTPSVDPPSADGTLILKAK